MTQKRRKICHLLLNKVIQLLVANFASRKQRIRGGVVGDDLILQGIDGFVKALAEERQVARKSVNLGAQTRKYEVGCNNEGNANSQVDYGDGHPTFNHGAFRDFHYWVYQICDGG